MVDPALSTLLSQPPGNLLGDVAPLYFLRQTLSYAHLSIARGRTYRKLGEERSSCLIASLAWQTGLIFYARQRTGFSVTTRGRWLVFGKGEQYSYSKLFPFTWVILRTDCCTGWLTCSRAILRSTMLLTILSSSWSQCPLFSPGCSTFFHLLGCRQTGTPAEILLTTTYSTQNEGRLKINLSSREGVWCLPLPCPSLDSQRNTAHYSTLVGGLHEPLDW